MEIVGHCSEAFFAGWAHQLLGEAALEANFSKALPQFEKSISIYKETKDESDLARSYFGLGRFYKKQGDHVQAKKYLRKALDIFKRLGTLIESSKVKKELAELPFVEE